MIRTVSYKATLALLFSIVSVLSVAQNKTTVKATADRQQILIGERIKLTLEAEIPENQPIRFFQLDTLPHFEFYRKEKIDTADIDEGTVLSQVIYITSFDSGHWVIPPLVLAGNIVTDSIPVDVGYSPFDPNQPYHDIKDIIEVSPEEENNGWLRRLLLPIIGMLLLIAILLWFFLRKRKQPVQEISEPPADPYLEAIKQLEQLARDKPEPKQYYSKLINILRVYLVAKKGIHSLQETTDELVLQLKTLGMPSGQFEQLSQSLGLSDFVKFAKSIPSEEDDNNTWDTIKRSIDFIEQMPDDIRLDTKY